MPLNPNPKFQEVYQDRYRLMCSDFWKQRSINFNYFAVAALGNLSWLLHWCKICLLRWSLLSSLMWGFVILWSRWTFLTEFGAWSYWLDSLNLLDIFIAFRSGLDHIEFQRLLTLLTLFRCITDSGITLVSLIIVLSNLCLLSFHLRILWFLLGIRLLSRRLLSTLKLL